MNKKLVLILTFIVSFIISINVVKADYDKIECVYKSNLYNGKSWIVGIVRNTDGTVQGYDVISPIVDYNRDLFLSDNSIYIKAIKLTTKKSDKEELETSSTSFAKEINSRNKCPKYVNLEAEKGKQFPTIFVTYDTKNDNKTWSNYSELEIENIIKSENNDDDDDSTLYKILSCEYEAGVTQKKFKFTQSKDGNLKFYYGSSYEDITDDILGSKGTLENTMLDTGFDDMTVMFTKCPQCVNKDHKIVQFSNKKENDKCPNSFLPLSKQTTNTNKEKKTYENPTDLCTLLGDDTIDLINRIMNIIRIIVPVLLLIFGVTDFFKAVFSGSSEDMKADRDRFFKRLIAALIVFIVPVFVNLVLKLANQVWSDINSETCIK